MHRFFLSWNVVPSVARRQQRPVLKRDKRNGQGGGRVELATLSPGGFSLGKGEILARAGRCPAPSSRHYRVRGHGRATAPPAGEGEPGANSAPCRSGGTTAPSCLAGGQQRSLPAVPGTVPRAKARRQLSLGLWRRVFALLYMHMLVKNWYSFPYIFV